MIKSIRLKLFIVISFLIVFFVLLSWILNTKYLGTYYTYQKKINLVESSQKIDEMLNSEIDDISLELERMERNSGINTTIVNKDLESIKYSSSNRFFDEMDVSRRLEPANFVIKNNLQKLQSGETVIEISKDPRLSTKFINLVMILDSGDYLVLNAPMQVLRESAEIANTFFLFTGIVTIFIGSIIALAFSKKFTNPILELSDIAQKMSNLDFSKKYKSSTSDEIGQLGNSINSLSEQLDKSISKLKEANRKLIEDIEKERKIDEMRKEFISNVSHELKTPISLIQGYAEGLKVNVIEDEENKNFYCDVIVDESKKMDKMVKELLDLSQIDSGYYKLDKAYFDICILVQYLTDKYEPIFREKNINVYMEKCSSINVYGDVVRIEQVLVNYINNAINHIDRERTIKIKIEEKQEKVKVSVFNTGKHIPDEYKEKIWQSFYKVDKARTRSYGGTGLGLSIVRVIQELHGNNYGVENIEKGVEFWFEIDKEKV